MPEKYKNKYTIKSSRLPGHDYSQNGMYFMTICTKDREEFFGKIEDGKMVLSEMGEIAQKFWQEIPKHFPFVILDEFIIMPNHVHGVLEINNDRLMENNINVNNKGRDAINRVSTGDTLKTGGITGTKNPMLNPGSLSKIMSWYKGRYAFEIRKQINPNTFAWQPRFYDHIIRNEISLNKIREYIQTNPEMWERDRNNPANPEYLKNINI